MTLHSFGRLTKHHDQTLELLSVPDGIENIESGHFVALQTYDIRQATECCANIEKRCNHLTFHIFQVQEIRLRDGKLEAIVCTADMRSLLRLFEDLLADLTDVRNAAYRSFASCGRR